MFLLPLQPLPGAPSVVSPESSGLLDIGTGFRDMLQTAQQQLTVEGAPDVPMPEQPVLAALMADLLEGATPPDGENSPKQIVSVLVPETALPEGDLVVPLDQELPAQDVDPNALEGILPEAGTPSQMSKPLTDNQRALEDAASEKQAVIVPVADMKPASPEPVVSTVVSSVLPDEALAPEPSTQPRAGVPTEPLQPLPTSTSEQTDAPLPVFGQPEAPLTQVKSVPANVTKMSGQEGDVEDVEVPMSFVAPLDEDAQRLGVDDQADTPQETDHAPVPVPSVVSEQTTPQVSVANIPNEQNLQDTNGQEGQQGQNQVLYSTAPPPKTQSDIPADGFTPPVSGGEKETGRTELPLQPVIQNGAPAQSGDVQVAENASPVVAKPILSAVEQTVEQTVEQVVADQRKSSDVEDRAPVAHVETGVERENIVPTSSQVASTQAEQPVAALPSQAPETSRLSQAPALSQAPENDSTPVLQNAVRREGLADAQAHVAQPTLSQDASLETVSENAQPVGAQPSPQVLQNNGSSQVNMPVAQPIISSDEEPASPVAARQNIPLASSLDTQTNASERLVQARPEMATLLSSEHNAVKQQTPSVIPRPTFTEGSMMQQATSASSESDILPQLPLDMSNVQDEQARQVPKPLENVSQPLVQAVGAAPVAGDQSVLPRHPAERLNAVQTSVAPEAESLNRPEVASNTGAQPLDRSQMASAPEAQPLNRSEFVAPLASVVASDVSSGTQEEPLSRSEAPQLVQQAQPIQREMAPARIEVQAPLAQRQQPVVQDAAVRQQVQAVAMEDDVQRSVERPVMNDVASSETAEARVFVAPEAQLHDDASRDQRAPSQQTFVAPQTVSEQPASFGEVVEQEILNPQVNQQIDSETQSIDRIPGRPDMRVDMMNATPRAASPSEMPQGQLNTMPSEEIDQQYRVGEQVIRNARVMTREGATQVTMRLDPQELGEVTIRLSSQDQVVSGEIAVESQKVQEIVQRNMGALREALAGQGIQLENIDVSVNDRGAQPDRETFRDNLEERSGEDDGREQPRSDSDRWEQNEKQQRQTSDGQVDFVA